MPPTTNLRFALAATVLVLSSCTWVKLTDGGAAIRVRNANAVGQCEKLATTTVKTTAKVVFERDRAKVIEELQVMARNSAAEDKAANTIVATTAIDDGQQSFDIYHCP